MEKQRPVFLFEKTARHAIILTTCLISFAWWLKRFGYTIV